MTLETLRNIRDAASLSLWARAKFGGPFDCRLVENGAPILVDLDTGIQWLVAPTGRFVFGLTERQAEAAKRIHPEPFLSFDEMGPARTVDVDEPFLVMRAPLTVAQARAASIDIDGTCGLAEQFATMQRGSAEAAARSLGGKLPNEVQWEYCCRGGSDTLFWWGDALPLEDKWEELLGLIDPPAANQFGCVCLYEGEWCLDEWAPRLDGSASTEGGWAIRGGASRFWPWQDSREWAGCVSSFRMPSSDTGGVGATVRLVKRTKPAE